MKVSASAVERRSRVHAVLNHVSIRLKLGSLAVFGALILSSIAGVMAWHEYESDHEGRREGIRQSVETARSVLEWAHEQEAAGAMTRAQAQAVAIRIVNGARYRGSEYFWINDLDARVLAHPFKPDLVGTDARGVRDPDGRAIFVEFIDTVRKQGAGYVRYFWPRPGSQAPVEKVSYVAGFAPWGWVIGSGLYVDDLREEFWLSMRTAAVGIAIALVMLIAWIHVIHESITRGLAKAARVAKAITGGDVSAEIELVGSDEIGDLIGEMKVMSEQLNATMSEVHQAAQELATTSRQIASSNQDLSSRTERTAANLQRAASTLSEISGSVRENAEASRRAADTVRRADEVAAQGGATVAEAVEQMQGVTGTSAKIADIIGLIDSIAFQTNILSLNAAVEAARAGTQGAGFAVVAAEVRSLAQRSAGAASEIKKLITESVQCTRDGALKVDAAGSSMGRIVGSIGEVNALISAISRASARQSDEVEQVNDAIAQLEQMTQQNAALVEESAAAAEGLHVQAHQLTRLVDRFKLRRGKAHAG
ncbi:MAG: methyl-accepting chemotaxis protein [Burkholderiaceae bacterium]